MTSWGHGNCRKKWIIQVSISGHKGNILLFIFTSLKLIVSCDMSKINQILVRIDQHQPRRHWGAKVSVDLYPKFQFMIFFKNRVYGNDVISMPVARNSRDITSQKLSPTSHLSVIVDMKATTCNFYKTMSKTFLGVNIAL